MVCLRDGRGEFEGGEIQGKGGLTPMQKAPPKSLRVTQGQGSREWSMMDKVEWIVAVGVSVVVDVNSKAAGIVTISWRRDGLSCSCGDKSCLYQVERLAEMLKEDLWRTPVTASRLFASSIR